MTTSGPAGRLLVRESVSVDLDLDQAFRLFTDGINQWWPLNEGFSFGGDRARSIHLEPWLDGRLYELWDEGESFESGRVIECDPPRRIVFTWRDAEDRGEMEVEVSFLTEDGGTRVNVEHRGFERLGPDGADLAARYGGGWPRVLENYRAYSSP